MTRPIGEPSWSKAQGEQDFGIRQLFRRPKQGEACDIQIFRAARYLSSVTVAGTSQITVDFDSWEYCDETIFVPLNTALNPASPGEKMRRLRLPEDGRYTISYAAHNTSDIAGTVEMALHDGDDVWSRPDSFLHGNGTGLAVGFYAFQTVKVYPIYDPFGGSNFVPELSLTLAQNGGSSEAFSEILMEVTYEPCVVFCDPGSS